MTHREGGEIMHVHSGHVAKRLCMNDAHSWVHTCACTVSVTIRVSTYMCVYNGALLASHPQG